ncbi:MAG: 5-formyltetrahydrofolate cyclo-ligase [Rickettsiales bacterium]|jgi:5-formyltetrahydrofolate cyclo-ligase|nr:5-formyltetrahydrofolate cyclo-ligase [Rickettsiales bacterium]
MTQPPSLVDDPKRPLREEFFAIRAHITTKQAHAAATAIVKGFLAAPILPEQACIAGYMPMGSEFDILPLMEKLSSAGYDTALPKIEKQHAPLIFHRWHPGEPLVLCKFHVLKEPAATAEQVIPDIVLVPLLAFDNKGGRLGFGGGYYDRTIRALRALNPTVQCIGIGYVCQEANGILPQEATDEKLDGIMTETGYIPVKAK